MTTSEMRTAIEAALLLIQNLTEARVYHRAGAVHAKQSSIAGADVNLEAIAIAMGRKVLERETIDA